MRSSGHFKLLQVLGRLSRHFERLRAFGGRFSPHFRHLQASLPHFLQFPCYNAIFTAHKAFSHALRVVFSCPTIAQNPRLARSPHDRAMLAAPQLSNRGQLATLVLIFTRRTLPNATARRAASLLRGSALLDRLAIGSYQITIFFLFLALP